jgi:hypothetical protein
MAEAVNKTIQSLENPRTSEEALPRRITDEVIEQPSVLVDRIAERPVFFYPAGLYDWQPLRWFGHLCSVFIYCDVAIKADYFRYGWKEISGLLGAENVDEPVPIAIQNLLAGTENLHAVRRYLAPEYRDAYHEAQTLVNEHGGPWGTEVGCRVGGKKITVYCFRAEAFQSYTALFAMRNLAPKVVCLRHPYPGPGGFVPVPWLPNELVPRYNPLELSRFLDLDKWAAPLGRAVADSPQPELVVTNTVRKDDWPWRREWKRFADWDAVAHWRQHPVTPPAPEAP